MKLVEKQRPAESPSHRTTEIFSKYLTDIARKTDRMFATLFAVQWLGGVLYAFFFSSRAWRGDTTQTTNVLVQAAFVLGGIIACYPIYLLRKNPGDVFNRYIVAIAQMLFSALFIHLSGGRIETHFHIFGSLAILSFYYDWRLLAVATLVTTIDHVVRGMIWPQSIYGVIAATPLRALEHLAWIVLADVVLFMSIRRSLQSMKSSAEKQVILETALDLADRANQEKSVFLANMSKEIRTPMTGILSRSRFGKQKIEESSKDKIKSYFDEIYDSGSQLMLLLNDLLDLTKLESGKGVFSMEKHRFRDAIEQVRAELTELAAERGLKLECSYTDADISGIFDQEKIIQVMQNLLSNAIKFSNRDSTIQVALERDSHDKNLIVCRVTNRGIGIPDTELEAIFDKFVQSSKTRAGTGGTGLGLAICKEIIEHHGGRIWAENKPDGSTQFTFELPTFPKFAERKAA